MADFAQLEIGLYCHGDRKQYRVELVARAPDSEIEVRPISKQDIVVEIDDGALGAKDVPAEYGKALADCLFGNPTVSAFFAEARSLAADRGVPLRVRLRADGAAGTLHDLHWEKVRDPKHSAFLCNDENILFSRYFSSNDWRNARMRPRDHLRALVVVANPTPTHSIPLDPVNVAGELERAQQGLKALTGTRSALNAVSVRALYRSSSSAGDPEWAGLPTFDNLIGELREECDILYLVCHGELMGTEPRIYLETENGAIDVRTLEEMVEPGGERRTGLLTAVQQLIALPRLVILASCQSAGVGGQWADVARPAVAALGPRLAATGVPAVLAMQGDVTMATVEQFMPEFFRELGMSGQIDAAVTTARVGVSAREDWWSPALYMRLSDGRIGWYRAEGRDASPASKPPPLRPVPKSFLERVDLLGRVTKEILHGTNPIVGLVGMGGVGKSALALYLAHALQWHFPDGVLWAELETSGPEAELVSFASNYGQADRIGQQLDLANKAEFVRRILADKKVLIVIDDAKDSEEIRHLLPTGPANRTLITTRDHMLLSDLDATIIEMSPFTEEEGLAYLRAQLGSDVVAAGKETAKRIIKDLGGLPLAMSLASSYMKVAKMSLEGYCQLLQNETRRLTPVKKGKAETRSQSVRATFKVSYDALEEPAKTLFTSLALWDGPDFGSQAVADVHKMLLPEVQIELGYLHSLSLVDMGLGEREALLPLQASSEGRHRLHALLRVFAREELGDSAAGLRPRLVQYYASFAHEHGTPEGYALLDLDWQNVVASLEWAYEQKLWEELVKGVLGLTQNYLGQMGFLDVRGRWSEARKILGWANAGADALGDSLVKARVLTNLAGFAVYQSDVEEARPYLEASLDLLNDLEETPETLLQKLYVHDFMHRCLLQSDYPAARQWLEHAIEYSRSSEADAIHHQRGFLQVQLSSILIRTAKSSVAIEAAIGAAEDGLALLPPHPTSARVSGLINVGIAYQRSGRHQESIRYYNEAASLAQELGDARRLASSWANIGLNERDEGRLLTAIDRMQQALAIYENLGDAIHQAGMCINIGSSYFRLADDNKAEIYLVRALTLSRAHHLSNVEAFAQSNLADLYLVTGRLDEATQALAQSRAIGVKLEDAYLLPTVLRQRAELELAKEDLDEAEELVEESLRLTQANGDRQEEGVGWRVKGRILNTLNQPDQALSAWRESLEILEDQDRYELALTKLTIMEAVSTSETSLAIAPDQLRTWADVALECFKELEAGRELKRAELVYKTLFPTPE